MNTKKTAPQPKGPKLESYQVLLKPIITEKGTHMVERQNVYSFQVHTMATKEQIKRAVEELFEVKVEDVRTQNRKGKTRRYRMKRGRTSNWKKAYVKVSEDQRISLF